MAIQLSKEVIEAVNDASAKKVLATVSEKGVPNVSFKGSLHIDEDGNIVTDELLETSQTNKNLVYSLWFEKEIAVAVWSDKGFYEIKGIPYRVLIQGEEFEKEYKAVRKRNPDYDLSGVWIIRPTEVHSENLQERFKEQKKKYPIIGHLDQDRNENYQAEKD